MRTRKTSSQPPAMPTEKVWGESDPSVDKYMRGDPEEWGEGVRPGPYRNSQPPAIPTEDGGHPGSLRAVLAKRARKCMVIASAFLGRTASTESVEDHALGMMDWNDNQIKTAYEAATIKLANEDEDDVDDGEEWSNKKAEEEEEEDEEEFSPKTASNEIYAISRTIMASAPFIKDDDEDDDEDERRGHVASILRMAEEDKTSCSEMPKMAEEEVEEDDREMKALKKCLAYLGKLPVNRRLKKIATFGRILKLAEAEEAALFTSEKLEFADTPQATKLNEHSQLRHLVESGGLGNSPAQSSLPVEGITDDLMGGVSDLTPDEESLAGAVSGDDFGAPEAQSGHGLELPEEEGNETDDLDFKFDDDDDEPEGEVEEEEEEEEEEEKPVVKTASVKKTASVQRPQPKKMSKTASPKRLGSVMSPNDSEIKRLSALWRAEPDVSEYFNIPPTDMIVKDYE